SPWASVESDDARRPPAGLRRFVPGGERRQPEVMGASTHLRYHGIRRNWIAPVIGDVKLSAVSDERVDRCFAKMRRLGASRSHMNQARSLMRGAFKWARRRKLVMWNPLAGYELPKSKHQSHEVVPAEVEELVGLLNAGERIPDVAP